MTAIERHLALDRIKKVIVAEAEESGEIHASLRDMHGGLVYVLYISLKIQDIRIVYAPPESIGAYGGDIDNWMWPRHCGDFSFLRAYVAPDGSPAAYSPENVPYRPKSWLKVSKTGVYENDLALMIGFPGRTDRYASSQYLDYLMNFYYPRSAEISEEILRIFAAAGAADSSAAIRLASWVSGINNGLKKSYGLREGFLRANAVELKRTTEKELAAFIAADPALDKKYGRVLGELDSLFQARAATREHDMVLGRLGQADYLQLAIEVYRWTLEREKEDIDREPGFQHRDTARTRRWLENAQINLVPKADRDLLRYFFHLAFDLPEGQRIKAVDSIFAGMAAAEREARLDEWLYNAYGQSSVGDLDERMKMFSMNRREIESLDDPFVNLAKALMPELDDVRQREKARAGATSRLHPLLIAAYSEWKNGSMYPDANGTKRLNYGSVRGYSPRDGVYYTIKTSLTGVMEKETGEDPFIVEPVLKQAWQKGNFGEYADRDLNDVAINFLTDNDGTGGNSGSPVLNGRGELIGLDFDSNYEGVAADYIYDEDLARSIVVDIRYVLFLMERVYHTDNLLRELEIVR